MNAVRFEGDWFGNEPGGTGPGKVKDAELKVACPPPGAVHKNHASPFEGPGAVLELPKNPEIITGFPDVSLAESNVVNSARLMSPPASPLLSTAM